MMGGIGNCQLDTLYEAEEQNPKTDEYNNEAICIVKSYSSKPAYVKHKEAVDLVQAQQDIENAKDEWELVTSTVPLPKPVPSVSSLITCEEVLAYFRSKDMTPFLEHIKPIRERAKTERFINWLFGPPKLHSTLVPDRDLIYAIALCPFDTSDDVHMRVLQTIYKGLTGNHKDCPRYGSHWEDIGFQGMDPATDLRGVGFLGLYHLLHFIFNRQTKELCKEVSSLAHSIAQEFPFCVMGINITRIVLETAREEVLNKEFNRKKDVFVMVNDFYVGLCLQFYKVWKGQKKTIMDSGFVLKDLGSLAKKNPALIFQGLNSYHEEKSKSVYQEKAHCSFSDISGSSVKPSAEML